jgi:DNA-binding NtrC family response regulator
MARILLVDDDPSLREVLSFGLQEHGHAVSSHADGASALRALDSFRAEVVITDLRMPGMSGAEVTRRVRERDPGIPVILLTAFGTDEEATVAARRGAFHCLTKPVHRDELEAVVSRALERRPARGDPGDAVAAPPPPETPASS